MTIPLRVPILCGILLTSTFSSNLFAMMEADKFVGAWRLVSAEFRAEDGSPADSPYGAEPEGMLIYDAQGVMSAQLGQKNRRPFAIPDRMAGTAEEIKAAFESYQAYYGRYKVDEKEHVVTHTVLQSLLPNWVGTEQRRYYKFRDGRLILRTPPFVVGGQRISGELVWEKIRMFSE